MKCINPTVSKACDNTKAGRRQQCIPQMSLMSGMMGPELQRTLLQESVFCIRSHYVALCNKKLHHTKSIWLQGRQSADNQSHQTARLHGKQSFPPFFPPPHHVFFFLTFCLSASLAFIKPFKRGSKTKTYSFKHRSESLPTEGKIIWATCL